MTIAALYIDPRGALASRFWAKVNKNGPTISPDLGPCWVWTASTDRKGYGQIMCRRADAPKRPERAHRVSWFLEHGREAVPCVLHHCDNRTCVRPAHLFEGTIEVNNADMRAKGRAFIRTFTSSDHVAALAALPRGDAHYARLRPDRVVRGERHGKAKLTDAEVACMRAERVAGARLSDLASKYGLSESGVSAICVGRNRGLVV